MEQFESVSWEGGLLLAVRYHEVVGKGVLLAVRCQEIIGKGMPYFVQVYIEAVRPGSVSVCHVHATTAEACFAASMIRLITHVSVENSLQEVKKRMVSRFVSLQYVPPSVDLVSTATS